MASLPCALKKVVSAPKIEEAQSYEHRYVHAVYEATAGHFSHTRSRTWPAVLRFCRSLRPGALILDCGCGNGRNMLLGQGLVELGLDYSANLCAIAIQEVDNKATKTSDPDTGGACGPCGSVSGIVRGDALALPFYANAFDAIICIAVIHHLSSEERRRQVFAELFRVMVPGGVALVTLWAREQGDVPLPREALVPWRSQPNNQNHKITVSSIFTSVTDGEPGVKRQVLQVDRYYHLYEHDEARQDAEAAGFQIQSCVMDSGNWTLTLLKSEIDDAR